MTTRMSDAALAHHGWDLRKAAGQALLHRAADAMEASLYVAQAHQQFAVCLGAVGASFVNEANTRDAAKCEKLLK